MVIEYIPKHYCLYLVEWYLILKEWIFLFYCHCWNIFVDDLVRAVHNIIVEGVVISPKFEFQFHCPYSGSMKSYESEKKSRVLVK